MINVLSLGGGVQSSALLEMSVLGVLPSYDLVLFADTGNEPSAVYRHVEYLQSITSIQIVRVGNICNDVLQNDRFAAMPFYMKMPNGKVSVARRQCTNEYKIQPIKHAILEYLESIALARHDARGRLRTTKRSGLVNMHLGISLDERQRIAPSRVKWMNNQYPLIEKNMTRANCIQWLKENNRPIPPKSSCIVCPYHTDDYWLSLPPSELEQAYAFDDAIRLRKTRYNGIPYLHSSCIPLREVQFRDKLRPIQLAFTAELLFGKCEGNAGFSCFS